MRKQYTLLISLLTLFLVTPGFSKEVIVTTEEGKSFITTLDLDTIPPCEETFSLWDWFVAKSHGQFLGYPRNYDAPVTEKQHADIYFIVTTLANKSIFTIAKQRDALEEAGDRIDRLHPLRFLMSVFTNEEMKVGIKNIRGKGWVWHDFIAGLKEALTTESSIGNLTDIQIFDFADKVGVQPSIIHQAVLDGKWEEFINLLIVHVPKSENSGRYGS